MELQVLKTVGQIAGIGGLAIGMLLLLFREVVRKNIFPHLAPEEAYRLLRLVLVLTWSVALGGIGAWVYVKNQGGGTNEASVPMKDYTIAGLVTDTDNNALDEVEVLIVGADAPVRTNSSGSFSLRTRAVENGVAVVRISKAGYKPHMQNVKFPSSGLIVSLAAAARPQTASVAAVTPAASEREPRSADPPPTPVRSNSPAQTGRIYLQYSGDLFACLLSLKVRFGSKEIVPNGMLYPVEDVPLGNTPYEITGTIGCPTIGACAATGSGRLTVKDEAHYNVLWQNTTYGRCDVRLVPSP